MSKLSWLRKQTQKIKYGTLDLKILNAYFYSFKIIH